MGSNPGPGILLRLFSGLVFVVLTWLSFPNMFLSDGCPVFGWVALVPFLAGLEGFSFYRRLLWSGGCSVALFLGLTFWMMDVSVPGWILFSLALAIGPFVFAALSSLIPPVSSLRLACWPGLWVLSEAARSFLLGGFTWSLAYSQSFVPQAIWSAAWGGVYLPVWIMVFVNSAFYLFLRERKRIWAFWGLGVLALNIAVGSLLMTSFVSSSSAQALARVVLIQPNVSKEEKQSESLYDQNARRHLALTKEAAQEVRPDLMVWPETAFPDDILLDPFWKGEMERLSAGYDVNMLVGSALLLKERDVNSALMLSGNGQWTGGYFKRKLVPFAEYVPAFFLRGLSSGHRFIPGESRGLLEYLSSVGSQTQRVRFGVVICSEEAYPELFCDLSAHGAAFAVVMLNDGWFQRKEALLMHAQNAAFRARESGLTVLRAANTGWSVAFDPWGRIIAGPYPRLQEAGWALTSVPPRRPPTPYVQYGDIFVWFCAGCIIIAVCSRKFFFKE